jgi:hypothetical protein
MEKIQTNKGKNRRLFQIMQIRTKLKKITQNTHQNQPKEPPY